MASIFSRKDTLPKDSSLLVAHSAVLKHWPFRLEQIIECPFGFVPLMTHWNRAES